MGPEQVPETLLPAWHHPPTQRVREGQREACDFPEPGHRGRGKEKKKKAEIEKRGINETPREREGDRQQEKSKNKSHWG